MFKTIKEVSNSINNGRKPQNVFYKVVEEVGELGQEIQTKYDPLAYKEKGKDGILGESCDILIALIDLLILEGYTEDEIKTTIINKCNKWKNKIGV